MDWLVGRSVGTVKVNSKSMMRERRRIRSVGTGNSSHFIIGNLILILIVGNLVGRLVGRLVSQSVDRMVGRSVGRLVCRLKR